MPLHEALAATRSRLITEHPDYARNCAKVSSKASRNVLKRMCASNTPLFFIVEPKMSNFHAERTLALPLSCFVMVFCSRVNGPHAGTKYSPTQSGISSSSISCSFFLLPIHQPFTVEHYGCLCVASFKADDKSLNLPNFMCFRVSIWRTHVKPHTKYTSCPRTPSVDLRFRSFR